MKVTVRGNNPITSEQVKSVVDQLNEEYEGLTVKNLTMYVRFVNEAGETVEPLEYGSPVELTYTFNNTKEFKEPKKGKRYFPR